ncbi:N-acetyltransferase [Methanocella sp. CWC-04]|uniref:N-acetyltransferase n=1 Tax=Methanooceanicella nereidis TaxID=2052831 RepID=A0AAP2RDM3_9EURY|nr:N-acetyltransferase [Methanocella sp. CWC-04]MCD1294100.1 N-acetyltransferase [Methanocella sp. CWC-04]
MEDQCRQELKKREAEPGINIRKAVGSDAEEMFRLECLCFDIEAFSIEQLRYLIHTRTSIPLVAEFDEHFAGFVIGLTNRNRGGIYGRIYTLDVDPACRGKGIGMVLMSRVLEELKRAGCKKCFLEVKVENKSAISLYKKLGFEEKDTILDYYAKGVHAIKMKKDLKEPGR